VCRCMIPSPPRRRCRLPAVLGTSCCCSSSQFPSCFKEKKEQKLQAAPRSLSIYKSQTTTPAYITTPAAAKHPLPPAPASLLPRSLDAHEKKSERRGGRRSHFRHAPCSSSRSWQRHPAGGTTLSDEATGLLLHEEGARAFRRAGGHGEAASGRGGGATTGQQEHGDGGATVATATGEGDDDDGVPRQLVRQAGHRVPVPEPSRSFRYSSRLRILSRSPPSE
jgi:hypothetical protein